MRWPGAAEGAAPAPAQVASGRGTPETGAAWPPVGPTSYPPTSNGSGANGPGANGPGGNGPGGNGPGGNGPGGNGPGGNGPGGNGPGGNGLLSAWPRRQESAGRPVQPGQRQIPARAALVAVPGALLAIVLAGVGAAIGQGLTGSSTSGVSDLLGEAGLWLGMLATVVFVSYRFGTASLPRDYGLAIKAKDPLWGVCAAVTAFLGAGLVLEIFSGTKFSGSNDQILTQQKGHDAGIVLVTLIVALGAPFFEELFFRGYLRTALQARFGRHGAVWLQAVFFGLAHAGEAGTALGNVSVVLAMITVGVVLGYTAMLTGRLGAGMVAHCLFNLVAVISVV
jgi:membrane protease YdiL (CAAX protease family)